VKEILESLALIVTRAHRITLECACRSGCPSCVHSAQCSEYNKVLDKRGALLVLAFLAEAYGAENEEGRRLE
jgi:DEAD/DEAH box helicase domain-containing protein